MIASAGLCHHRLPSLPYYVVKDKGNCAVLRKFSPGIYTSLINEGYVVRAHKGRAYFNGLIACDVYMIHLNKSTCIAVNQHQTRIPRTTLLLSTKLNFDPLRLQQPRYNLGWRYSRSPKRHHLIGGFLPFSTVSCPTFSSTTTKSRGRRSYALLSAASFSASCSPSWTL